MVKLTHIKPPHLNMQMRKDGQMHTWFYLSASGILKQKKKKKKTGCQERASSEIEASWLSRQPDSEKISSPHSKEPSSRLTFKVSSTVFYLHDNNTRPFCH